MFMQAGFAFLEIGFSRGKNAGTGVAKILANFSIAARSYWWACGFAFAFGGRRASSATHGFFLPVGDPQRRSRSMGQIGRLDDRRSWLFQFMFCAVSLAIVWGTTLERIKFGAYVIYAIVFAGAHLPDRLALGVRRRLAAAQRRAACRTSPARPSVHLIGATGALAALLLLGPRRGKYGNDGKPRAIPGHSMPLVRPRRADPLARLVRLQPGLDAQRDGRPLRRGRARDELAAAAGVLGAIAVARLKTGTIDIGMAGNGAIGGAGRDHGAVGLRRAVGGADHRPDRGRHRRRSACTAIEKKLDDPVGALTAHGLCRRLGHARVRHLHRAAPGGVQRVRRRRLWSTRARSSSSLTQALGVVVVFSFVFTLSYGTFWAIKKTLGLRVTAEEEDAGLDISEHGMYGYPEQFIPRPSSSATALRPAGCPARETARGAHHSGGAGLVKKIEAFIRHEAFEPIRMELLSLGFPSLTISEVKGSGRQKGITERYRGAELTNWLRPKIKLECVVATHDVQTVVDAILKHARTGQIGDGKVFVMPVEEAYRIRTGESGEETLQAHPEVAAAQATA